MNNKFQEYSVQISTPDQYTPIEDSLGSNNHTWHGTGIMWHGSLNSDVLHLKNTSDRFTGIRLNTRGQPILAISAYLPTSGKDEEFANCLDELSAYIGENMEQNDVVLVGLDSNCSEKSTNRRYQVFQSFCTEQNLTKIYSPGPTFHHSNGSSSSNIDFFLVSAKYALHITNTAIECSQEHPENFSSHDPVFSKLSVATSVKTSKLDIHSHTYTPF